MLLPLSIEPMFEVTPCMIKEPSQQSDRSDKEWFAQSHRLSRAALHRFIQPMGTF